MRVVNGERAIMSEANARGRLYIEARDIGTNRMLRSIEVVRSQALTKEAQFLLDWYFVSFLQAEPMPVIRVSSSINGICQTNSTQIGSLPLSWESWAAHGSIFSQRWTDLQMKQKCGCIGKIRSTVVVISWISSGADYLESSLPVFVHCFCPYWLSTQAYCKSCFISKRNGHI